MMTHDLTKNVLTKRLPPDATALTTWTLAGGQTAVNTPGVDTSGYWGIRFLVSWGAISGTAVTSLKLQQSDDDGSTDAYDDLAGSNKVVADTDDNKVSILEVHEPLKKYVRLAISRGTANAAIDEVKAELFHAGDMPVTQDGTVQGTPVILLAPLEGTA